MTAILIQVKNDKSFTKVHEYLFEAMNPFHIGVFDDSTAQPRPIIRMVFALASSRCEVTHVARPRGSKAKFRPGKFTAYDFWCGGLDDQTFPIIAGEDRMSYQRLLARPRDRDKLYDVGTERMVYSDEVKGDKSSLLRQFDPLLETGPEHQYLFSDPASDDQPPAA
jgi:hypothetical protein